MFFVLGLVLGVMMVKISQSKRREGPKDNGEDVPTQPYEGLCKYHKWAYENGRLKCSICNMHPGEF